ncbi:hypothetical protein [Cellulomonas xylanilytica]|uniref:Enoyl reductase n=1 Tax=Cellulomonas xylanilytica TaxID=233583 RepID=A0A510V611_9CELL|nr:hypothetical protein [Cellulomonas xylanilytica]GEK22313.1 hypothetical protein CXY01_28330 [Cellulomonas xylanilytica]
MLKRLPLVLATAAALVLGAVAPATAAGGIDGDKGGTTPPEVTPGSGNGSIQVVITQSTSSGGGVVTTTGASTAWVAPMCWFEAGMTGYEYYEYWKPGGPARESDTLDDYAYQGLLNPEYEKYATDQTGYWYDPTCQFDAPASTRGPYILRESIYVPAGTPPPVAQVEIDPEVLARAARDAMELPQGELRWNPSLDGTGATVVNAETWVWLDGGAPTVFVRAEIPNVLAATVTANMTGLTLEGDGAGVTRCDGPGTPWTAGAGNPTCSLTFTRSSADGTTSLLPTSTLTATQNWTASWSTDADPTPREIEGDTVTTTAELPVAEIQSIVTRR